MTTSKRKQGKISESSFSCFYFLVYLFLKFFPDQKFLFVLFLIYLFIYLFIFGLSWVFIAVRGPFLVAASRGYSTLRCAGFSLRWLLLLRSMGSRHAGFSSCGSRALERRLSSCGTWAQLLHGMWDLPRPGLEPTSPALAGRFLTTAPPGKSLFVLFLSSHQ